MIRSTIEARYRTRTNEIAIIEVAITEWRYDPLQECYVATVEDYAVITDGENETKTLINTKHVYYSNQQIDDLFRFIAKPIMATSSFSHELKMLLADALLYVTQTDLFDDQTTIYGLQPIHWVKTEIYNRNSNSND